MFRFQYEADPQTMWRAEASEFAERGPNPEVALPEEDWWGTQSGGVHFGDYGSAKQRGKVVARSTKTARFVDPTVRLYSLRVKGRFSNEVPRQHPAKDVLPQTRGVPPDRDHMDWNWPQRRTGRWYYNEGEIGPSTDRGPAGVPAMQFSGRESHFTLSGYVPNRLGHFTTHKEEVLKAHAAGINVSPAILHEAQFRPEHSETVPPTKPEAPEPPKLFVAWREGEKGGRYYTPEEYDAAMQEITDHQSKGKPLKFTATLGDPVPAGALKATNPI
jgi:hypothetical protein